MTNEKAIEMIVNATYSEEWQGNEDLTTANIMAVNALKLQVPQKPYMGRAFNNSLSVLFCGCGGVIEGRWKYCPYCGQRIER